MSVFCSGNPGVPKSNSPAILALSVAAFDLLLEEFGLPWLIPFMSAWEAKFITLNSFCAAEPPAIPTFTYSDLINLFVPFFPTDGGSAFSKIGQLGDYLVWLKFCECQGVATPAPPSPITPKPFPMPNVPGVQAGLCVAMLPSNTKIFAYDTAGSPAAPPAGWDTNPAFNDSTWLNAPGWGDALVVDGQLATSIAGTCSVLGTCREQYIAPWEALPNSTSGFVMRWHPVLPAGFDYRQLCIRLATRGMAINVSTADVNANSQFPIGNTLDWQNFGLPNLVAGYNTVAMSFPNSVPAGNFVGAAASLSIAGGLGGPPSSSCCPPDPSVSQALSSIQSALALLTASITTAPRSLSLGTVHPGLSGSGSFALSSPAIGIRVHITTLPPNAGLVVGSPDFYDNLGWLTPVTELGPLQAVKIGYADQCIFLPPTALTCDYTLLGGMVVTFQEINRGP